MEKIKQILDFIAQGFNDFDFVRLFNRIVDFFKILFPGKGDDTTTANA
ncbi:MAG: hypothetical protein Q4D20_08510 [Clostridia bacterium]|nr:hypothetical protein [Clostridia bacterium]